MILIMKNFMGLTSIPSSVKYVISSASVKVNGSMFSNFLNCRLDGKVTG
jgi:hypothetical protein